LDRSDRTSRDRLFKHDHHAGSAMRVRNQIPSRPLVRRVLAVAALIGQVFGVIGGLVPVGASAFQKSSSIPFPCQARPCGCLTAEQCWSGPCCCFTMKEKLAWAAENGFTPPASAVRLVETEQGLRQTPATPPKASCCSKGHSAKAAPKSSCCEPRRDHATNSEKPAPSAPVVKWVLGIAAQHCHGEAFAGLGSVTLAVPPVLPVVWCFDSIEVETLHIQNDDVLSSHQPPLAQPPRV
jgi:hypothetical protein